MGRCLDEEDISKLKRRFSDYKKGIPVSKLGIKSWGIIDYANSQGIYINLDWRN